MKGDPGIPGEPGAPGADALKNVTDNGTYYTITYSDNTTVNVQKWVDASNVTIEFFNVSLSDLGNATTPVTELSISEEKTILYRVNGSASGTAMPNVMATSEGGYVISCTQPTSLSALGSVGQITITPTYAFATGAKNGRVVVFIDYYGTTIMKELILKGSANVEVHQTITVEASNGSAEIDLADLGLTGRPALGFSYSYNDFVDRTGQSDNFVYADKVGTSTDKWISRGTDASAYNIQTGKETLTISDNPTNLWRAGMVVVYPSKDSQVELAHIKIIQKPGETNLANPDKSGPDDPANCYVVSEPGRYLIPTYKGNNTTQTYDFSTIDTPISDGTGVTISTPEKVVRDGKQYISFDVNMSQTAGTSDVVNNNSMIAVRDDSGNVVWSWHLWFTSGVENSNYGILGGETYNTNATMLNRNLGADAARSTGMYYKWGDKDPYFTTTGGSTDYHGGTDAGDWSGATKSMTDPCPPGYRVPSTAVWNPNQNAATTFGTDYFTYEGSPLVLYPYSGFINESGVHEGQNSNKVTTQTTKDVVVGSYEIPKNGDKSYTSLDHKQPRKYRNVVFSFTASVESGIVQATDGFFLYGYGKNGANDIVDLLLSDKLQIISCERLIGTLEKGVHYTEKTSWLGTTTRTYTGVEPYWGTDWQTITSFGTLEGPAIKGFIQDYLESIGYVNVETYDINKSKNTTQGYQVRCVSENSTVK